MTIADYSILAVFLAGLFFLGSYFYRWIGSAEDFQVVGRQLTPFILAATMISTNMNLYNFIGETGSTYQYGISVIWHEWTGNMALVFSGMFVIPIMRRLRVHTIPEFLEHRYGKSLRSLVSVLWIFRISGWLGIVLYTGATLFQVITQLNSFTAWILILTLVTVVYTFLGGLWAISIMHVIEFLFMLGGTLIIVPIVMRTAGWLPGLLEKLPQGHFDFIAQTGPFNWKFTLAIFLLGLQWASTDQGMLQAAFGARNSRTVAKGMILGGVALTAFNVLIFIPGLAARALQPGLENFDMAVPTLLSAYLPPIVLGLVICGLVASQLSTIDANLAAVATLFANDLYKNVFRRQATQQDLLRVTRLMTIAGGVLMIVFAFLVPKLGGAVNAYLTMIGIMDMPLFVVAIVYGLTWKRATEKGALWAYLAGAVVGAISRFGLGWDNNLTTFVSAGVALVTLPIISWLSKPPELAQVARVWAARTSADDGRERYHIMPRSAPGKICLGLWAVGLVLFLVGTITGAVNPSLASVLAITGMVIYFIGGFLKLTFD